jgi:hypothetical protein
MNEIINYTDKPISEFTKNDTFYSIKTQGGFEYTFFLEFIKFEKGIITGKVCGKIQPNNKDGAWIGKEYIRLGSEMSFRLSKCYTWSKQGCHWFKKNEKEYRCFPKNIIY